MLMCNTCYSLFKENNSNNNNCYIHGCNGTLVRVDNEIGYHVSELNKKFRSRGDGVRTKYCCSAHAPSTFRSYIVFTDIPNYTKKNESSMDIYAFHDFLLDYSVKMNQNSLDLIKEELNSLEIDNQNMSKNPFTVFDIVDSHESTGKEFKIEFNIFDTKYIKSNIRNLVRISNLSSYIFSKELINLHDELSR